MFGFVMANIKELSKQQQDRYLQLYCGICRDIRKHTCASARLGLSYDMVFLTMLLMSLYEPGEEQGKPACHIHPIRPRVWVDNAYVDYGAYMNVALAYYKALDDYRDEHKLASGVMARKLEPYMEGIRSLYPRQCEAIAQCIERLSALEQENCPNPDLPAAEFGTLMGELFVYREDMWAETLRQMGMELGRFIYLADAAVDYRKDRKKHQYNPYLAMGQEENWEQWDQYLVLALGRCTDYFERLPLVQDKDILNNILYSGIWLQYRRQQKGAKAPVEENNDRRSL